MAKLINIFREFPNDYMPVIPIIHSWDLEEGNEDIPSLATYLNITKDAKEPQVYMI